MAPELYAHILRYERILFCFIFSLSLFLFYFILHLIFYLKVLERCVVGRNCWERKRAEMLDDLVGGWTCEDVR